VQLAGRTQDPEGVGKEIVKLLNGNAAAVRKGIRHSDEVPPRYAIPDVVEMIKGPGSLSLQLSRLQERYPEVFEKERCRVRERYGDGDTFCISTTVRFRDCAGRLNRNGTPVATIHGIIDIVLLLPGKISAALRSQVIDVFVRFVGGGWFKI